MHYPGPLGQVSLAVLVAGADAGPSVVVGESSSRRAQVSLVAGVVPDVPGTTPVASCRGVRALAGADGHRAARPQVVAGAEPVGVAGRVANGPSVQVDGSRGEVLQLEVLRVQTRVRTGVAAGRVVLELRELDRPGRIGRRGDHSRRHNGSERDRG